MRYLRIVVGIAMAWFFIVAHGQNAAKLTLTHTVVVDSKAPVLSDTERLYTTVGGRLIAISARSGKVVWRVPSIDSPHSPNSIALLSTTMYVLRDRTLVFIDAPTGRVRRRVTLPTSSTKPAVVQAHEGRLVVGFACPGDPRSPVDDEACKQAFPTVGVGLDPVSGRILWRLEGVPLPHLKLLALGTAFAVWVNDFSTDANPDPQTLYGVLGFPTRHTALSLDDLGWLPGSQLSDSRQQWLVGSRLYTVGNDQTRESGLDALGSLGIEEIALPSLTRRTFQLPASVTVACGSPVLWNHHVQSLGFKTVLRAEIQDDCGFATRVWLLDAEPLPLRHSERIEPGMAHVFSWRDSWWAWTVGSRNVVGLDDKEVTLHFSKDETRVIQSGRFLLGYTNGQIEVMDLETRRTSGVIQIGEDFEPVGAFQTVLFLKVGNVIRRYEWSRLR